QPAVATPPNVPMSPTSPLAPYPPLDPAETQSRRCAPEFYGFVASLLSVLYLLWAFLPDACILALGVTWYPNREWSLLIPVYGMVLILLTSASAPPASTAAATTAAVTSAAEREKEREKPYVAQAQQGAIPQLYDIPLGMVNHVVYSPPPRCTRR
ncbi:PIG-P-domain-containing protein, partial [Earliella scabrosa]